MTNTPLRLPAIGPRAKVALGLLGGLVLIVALFDWNWLRPLVERHLTETSRRSVKASDLKVFLAPDLRPTVRLRGVEVENAPWADTRQPFARVGEVAFTFDWKSLLFDGPPVVTRLVLRDADIDMQRQADGLRNWRLTKPDDRGPPRIFVRTIEAHDTRLRYLDRGMGLDLSIRTTELANLEGGYTQHLSFTGRREGAQFSGDFDTGPTISLRDSNQSFPLRGHAGTRETRVEIDGRATDLLQLAGVDAMLHLSGPSLAQLHPFLPMPLPSTHAYRAEGQLKKDGDVYAIDKMRMTLGETDLAGELHYDERSGRPTARATLRSQKASLSDLGTLVGGGAFFAKAAAPAASAASSASTRVLPQQKLPIDGLKGIDAQLDLQVRTFKVPGFDALNAIRLSAFLDQGVLDVSPIELELGRGRLSGRIGLDTRQQPAAGRAELKLRGVRLASLLPALPDQGELDGPLQGHLKLAGRGDSLAALLGSVDGTVSLGLDGGRISSGLDARMGLNGGKLLRHFLRGDEAVPIRCASWVMEFHKGLGTTRRLVFDTAQTHLEGQGHIGLDDETFEFLLTPQAQGRALLALNQSIRVKGSFNGAGVELAPRAAQRMAPGCGVGSPA